MTEKIAAFIKKELVLVISFFLALVSTLIQGPGPEYFSYIDFRTLAILFCMMAVISGFRKLGLFKQIAEFTAARLTRVRSLSLCLILLCFFLSMLITNDVALISFVPFTIILFEMTGKEHFLLPVILLETIAANLGSMLTPMGNPQNLYLYSLSGISFADFVKLLLPYTALSLLLILLLIPLMIKKETIETPEQSKWELGRKEKVSLVLYILLFVLAILTVLRLVDWRIAWGLIILVILLHDAPSLLKVDYSLLFTFVFLFIFIGNLSHLDSVRQLLRGLLASREVPVSACVSQFISNVPAAILLSGFTDNLKGLMIGSNIGGLGTLIASMASLISFKFYSSSKACAKGRYVLLFSLVNFALFFILLGFHALIAK